MLLTAARAVAAVESSDREVLLHESATATGVARSSVGISALVNIHDPGTSTIRDIRAETIRATQRAREADSYSLGDHLAEKKPTPTNALAVKVLHQKKTGLIKNEDAGRDFRFNVPDNRSGSGR